MLSLIPRILATVPAIATLIGGVGSLATVVASPQDTAAPFHAIQNQSIKSIELKHEQLTESSGVCLSGDGKWVFTHNDSGDGPRIFVFDREGEFTTEAVVESANAIDWEDICSFEHEGERFLAIGDIGDNLARRDSITVYLVREPTVDDLSSKQIRLSLAAVFTIKFDTGPVNCEALAYDPLRKVLLLVSKEVFRCRLFEVSLPDPLANRTLTAEHQQTLFLPLVTAADISADGKSLVLATYTAGALAKRGPKPSGAWQLKKGEKGSVFPLPPRRQGESICFGDEGKTLLLTSEFAPTPLLEMATPKL